MVDAFTLLYDSDPAAIRALDSTCGPEIRLSSNLNSYIQNTTDHQTTLYTTNHIHPETASDADYNSDNGVDELNTTYPVSAVSAPEHLEGPPEVGYITARKVADSGHRGEILWC